MATTAEKAAKERRRLLRLLGDYRIPPELEWPCNNPVLRQMVEAGEVELLDAPDQFWKDRFHKMKGLKLSAKGVDAARAYWSGEREDHP